MRYVLDTNLLSELRKGNRANRGVLAWAMANDPEQSALSVVTICEIRKGIEDKRLKDGPQARELERWLGEVLVEFANNVLPVTVGIAHRWGVLLSKAQGAERDLLIAATALEHDMTVVTRNVADFRGSGVRLVNPWK